MSRTLTATALSMVLFAACAHDGGGAQTTTIRSGTPGGVRVTNVDIGDADRAEPAERLAGELCRHAAICGRIEAPDSAEANLLAEQNCVTVRTPRIREALQGWGCSPETQRARFEACLAAIRSEGCETRLDRADVLPACRASAVCGP